MIDREEIAKQFDFYDKIRDNMRREIDSDRGGADKDPNKMLYRQYSFYTGCVHALEILLSRIDRREIVKRSNES